MQKLSECSKDEKYVKANRRYKLHTTRTLYSGGVVENFLSVLRGAYVMQNDIKEVVVRIQIIREFCASFNSR